MWNKVSKDFARSCQCWWPKPYKCMIEFSSPNSRAPLPTFRTYFPDGFHFTLMGSHNDSHFVQNTTTNPCSLVFCCHNPFLGESTATLDGRAQKLENNLWHDSELIATKVCSQINSKWTAMFATGKPYKDLHLLDKLLFLIQRFIAICSWK